MPNRAAMRRLAAINRSRQPDRVVSLFDEAVRYHQAGALEPAERIYRKIITIDSKHAMVWSNLAAILTHNGSPDEAVAACRTALGLLPGHLNATLNLVGALHKKDMFDAAIDVLDAAVRDTPQRLELWKTYGMALERAGRREESLGAYEHWISLAPESVDARMSKSDMLKKLGRVDDAIACYGEVVALDANHANAYSEMGILVAMHSLSNDLDEAAGLCLRAAALKPDSLPILNNLGVVLQIRGDTENALLVFQQMVEINPGFAPAHSNIGSIFSSRNRYDEAEDAFMRALDLDPNLGAAKIEITKVRRNICDWSQDKTDHRTVAELTGDGTNFLIVLMTMSTSGEEQLRYARTAMAKTNASGFRIGAHRTSSDRKRIRLGYISADFKDHPVGRLIPDLIANHDRNRFEVNAYSLGPGDQSALRQRIIGSFDRFIDLNLVSDALAATRILEDEIDILVDLTGPTALSRVDILALRPAPVQVNFLGMPGTTGANCIDYILADRFMMPAGSDSFYSEKVVRLPNCYQPSDMRRPVGLTAARSDFGLPETGFVFASFNSAVKITPEVFDVWMRLLKSVDGSVLWLYAKTTKTRRNLLDYAERAGVGSDRIVFAGSAPFDVYLTRLACADLFLDTFPYAAGATCNDALWMGLPVLTLVGETYTSRMAGSQVTALGVPELVAVSICEYEKKAVELATISERLEDIRRRMARNRETSPLFDMPRFARSLESAYDTMVARADAGQSPAAFDVEDDDASVRRFAS